MSQQAEECWSSSEEGLDSGGNAAVAAPTLWQRDRG